MRNSIHGLLWAKESDHRGLRASPGTHGKPQQTAEGRKRLARETPRCSDGVTELQAIVTTASSARLYEIHGGCAGLRAVKPEKECTTRPEEDDTWPTCHSGAFCRLLMPCPPQRHLPQQPLCAGQMLTVGKRGIMLHTPHTAFAHVGPLDTVASLLMSLLNPPFLANAARMMQARREICESQPPEFVLA